MTINITLLSMKEFEVRGQGIPRYTIELYNNLKKFEKDKIIKIRKYYFPRYSLLGDALSFEISSILYKIPKNEDILHIPSGFFILHNLPKHVKIISTIHDVNPLIVQTNNIKYILKDRIWRYLALKRGINYNINISDAILVNSTQTKDEVITLGVDNSKVFVVNHGIDIRFLKDIMNNKNNNKNNFVVGYIGSFATNKNINFIIDYANNIIDNKISFELWGAKTYDYKRLIKKTSSLKNIRFMGFAPEDQLVNIYDSFDVFVFPSLYEGFGLPILEAQSRGIPVIIYKYGKIPKEVRKYCFEAESPEHMAQIIENLKENGYNEKLRKEAMNYARSFTWEKTAKETLEVYKQLVNIK